MKLFNADNKFVDNILRTEFRTLTPRVDAIYADMMFTDLDFTWVEACVRTLSYNGVIIIQADYHSVAQLKLYMDSLKLNFINWCIYIQEWGGISRRYYPRKHDDILIYSKGEDYKFHYERIMVPKVTAGTAFDKNGGMKIPHDVFCDLGNFMTTSKERVKVDGKNIKYQKPLKLINRLLLPFTDPGDVVLDPFMGSGTTGVWCIQNGREFIGVEIEETTFNLAKTRIEQEQERINKK